MARRADKDQAGFLTAMGVLAERWQGADPSSFGLTIEQAQGLIDRYHAALLAAQSADAARLAARKAVAIKGRAMADLRGEFGALSGIIDGVARSTGDPGVYAAAGIARPGPRRRRPAPPPPRLHDWKVRSDGSIAVVFTIDDGGLGSLVYEVRRQTGTADGRSGPWRAMGVISRKRFIDRRVPVGIVAVRYQVRAVRSNGGRSDWASFGEFRFGTLRGCLWPAGDSFVDSIANEAPV